MPIYYYPLIDPVRGARLLGGDQALYLRLVRSFAQDESFSLLQKAMASGDAGGAYLHAHALKGLSAQLALPKLARRAEKLCTLLCAQGASGAKARRAFAALERCRKKTLAAIDRL